MRRHVRYSCSCQKNRQLPPQVCCPQDPYSTVGSTPLGFAACATCQPTQLKASLKVHMHASKRDGTVANSLCIDSTATVPQTTQAVPHVPNMRECCWGLGWAHAHQLGTCTPAHVEGLSMTGCGTRKQIARPQTTVCGVTPGAPTSSVIVDRRLQQRAPTDGHARPHTAPSNKHIHCTTQTPQQQRRSTYRHP